MLPPMLARKSAAGTSIPEFAKMSCEKIDPNRRVFYMGARVSRPWRARRTTEV